MSEAVKENPPNRYRLRNSLVVPVGAVVIGLMLFAAFVAGYGNAQSNQQTAKIQQEIVRQNNNVWCQTLDLLTKKVIPKPADPKANPSREQDYQFYVVFTTAKQKLKC
jgi:hypothetical protein